MKKGVLGLACCCILLFSSVALADGMYGSANLGLGVLTDSDVTDSTLPGVTVEAEYDKGMVFSAAIGNKMGNKRIEAELLYQKNDFDSATMTGVAGTATLTGDVTALSLMVNGYLDFDSGKSLTPFITAGIGFTKIDVDDFGVVGVAGTLSDDDTVFSYQLGAGLGYAVNDTTTIDCKYRYFGTADPEFGTTEADVGSHNFTIGLRKSF